MMEILKSMAKEEWRIHSSMFGSFMFGLLPVLIAAFAFAGTLFLPMFYFIPREQMVLLVHWLFVLFGMSVGAFGLLGREVMNRRFGSASLVAYASRTLPVSLRRIFMDFIIKDILFYFAFWILPFVAGFFFASLFLSINLVYSAVFLLTLTLSFLMGLSAIFFLSTVYAHSAKLLLVFLAVSFIFVFSSLGFLGLFSLDMLSLLPSYSLFLSPSLAGVSDSLILILLPFLLSLAFFKADFPERKRMFRNAFDGLSSRFSFSSQPGLISKDMLDLQRSEGGFGKIVFSLIFPVSLIWLMIYIFTGIFPQVSLFLLFSILLGVISSTIYNWLTEFEVVSSYSFLPVRISSIIRSKITSFMMINIASVAILMFAMLATGSFIQFLPALFAFASISAYSLAVTIYFTGLHPNILLYNAKVFLQYLIMLTPVLLAMIFLSFLNPLYLVAGLLLIPLSLRLIRKSFIKWDKLERAVY